MYSSIHIIIYNYCEILPIKHNNFKTSSYFSLFTKIEHPKIFYISFIKTFAKYLTNPKIEIRNVKSSYSNHLGTENLSSC